MNIVLTGGNGFIGRRLLYDLLKSGHGVTAVLRRPMATLDPRVEQKVVDCLAAQQNWTATLPGHQVVVHLAARVHVMNEVIDDPLVEYRRVNVSGTLNLARQAVASGIKRFIFLSSVKVNGESTKPGHPVAEQDQENPQDHYSISKYEAEVGLHQIASETGLEVVIVRTPLVYGPGVKANFQSMISWINKGIPLPLGAIHNNKRSLIALDNLIDFIVACIDHPAAANQTFLVSDGKDLSTTELLHGVAQAMGKKARLFPVPIGLLNLGATLLGKKALFQRLCGSLQVDISKSRQLLGWNPPITVEEGLRRAVRGG